MYRKHLLTVSLFIVAFAFIFANTVLGDIVIDSFTDTSALTVYGGSQNFVDQTELAGVLGGNRRINIDAFGAFHTSVNVYGGFGFYTSADGSGANVTISYDMGGPSLYQDFTGLVAFQMELFGYDKDVAIPVTITVVSVGGDTASSTVMMRDLGMYSWAFNDFVGDNVDWSLIDTINLDFDVNLAEGGELYALDFRVGPLAAVVPTPASMALLAIGLGMVVIRRRFV